MSVALAQTRNGGRPLERAPKQRRKQGVVVSRGRGQPATKQQQVVLGVVVRKDEIDRRARCASGDPNDLYGPPTRNKLEGASVHVGQAGLCRLTPGSTFRQALTSDTNVEVEVNMAGLSRSEPLGMPCVLVNSRDNMIVNGEDRATIAIAGTETIVHTGKQPVGPGQPLMFDPNPNMIEDESGRMSSAVLIEGLPADHLHVQTRPLLSTTIDTTFAHYDNEVRKLLGTLTVQLNQQQTGEKLFDLLRREVKTLCDQQQLSIDTPLRLYMLIQAAWMYRHFGYLNLLADSRNKTREERIKFRVQANIAHRNCLLVAQQHEDATLAGYERTMPQTFKEPVSENDEKRKQLLAGAGDYMKKIVVECKSLEELEEGELRLAAHHQRMLRVCYSLLSAYYGRFVAGLTLSSAVTTQPLDVLLGGC